MSHTPYAHWTPADWVAHYNGAPKPAAVRRIVGMRTIVGLIVTPGDVLAYRSMWNQYVADSVHSALTCADVLDATADNQDPSLPQIDPANQQAMHQLAAQWRILGNNVWAKWNEYAGKSDEFILLEASTILQTFQQTVIDAGDLRSKISTGPAGCKLQFVKNGQVVQAVPGPDPSLQARVISRIEGLGIIGKGILQILLDTASASLQEAGSAASWLGGKVKNVVDVATSPWTWGILAGLAGLLILKSGDVAKVVHGG